MVYLLLDPRIYFPRVNESNKVITWFSNIVDDIVLNKYSINIVIIKDIQNFNCETPNTQNILKKPYMKELLMLLQQRKYCYVRYENNINRCCDNLELIPDILKYITNENIKDIIYAGICNCYSELHTNNLLSCFDPNNINKKCYCCEDYDFNNIKSMNVVKCIQPFISLFNKYSYIKEQKIDYEDDTMYSIRANMICWYKSRYHKIMHNFYNQFEISQEFINDIKEFRTDINDTRLIGSMMRTIISPSYKQSCASDRYVIECHINDTSTNSPTLIIEGEEFEIKRTYVLEDTEHTRGSRLDRIISTKYNNKIIFLNYVHNHDITDNKIKKSIRTYLS